MMSVNLTDTDQHHLYLDGVSDLTINTYTDAVIDFTRPDHGLWQAIEPCSLLMERPLTRPLQLQRSAIRQSSSAAPLIPGMTTQAALAAPLLKTAR